MSELCIVQVNDTHGYLKPHPELFWEGRNIRYETLGGYHHIAGLVDGIREEGPALLFDCGDTIHGTYHAVKSEGTALIPILNEMRFDAMTAHWEFAYGPRKFMEVAEKLNHPVLAINCYHEGTERLAFRPYEIVERGDLQVGVVGIASNIVDKVMPPRFSEGLEFTLGRDELPYWIEVLRDGERVDLVVVISHLGFPQECQLAADVDGIDVLLSAHTHNRLERPFIINDTIIIQSGCHGSFIGRLDLEVDGGVRKFKHELVRVRGPSNEDVEEMVMRAAEVDRDYLEAAVGSTSTHLNRYTILESTMDNLLLRAIMDVDDSELAFSNGWRYGAPVPPGDIRVEDLWNMIPVNPPVSRVELLGREILAMMEENIELTFSRDPYRQMGGYLKRCMGLEIYFKIENPPGSRIQKVFVNGKPLEPDRTYSAVYVTSQGVPSRYGDNHEEMDIRAVDALREYVEKNSPVDAELDGRITPV
ncbi:MULTISPECIES: bifunctional UDP-sugar hydrolase/5'-nucleotidase [Methanothermobacter]|uniref:bifunctional metallophosphatase/5'-nucleotidase n=1 Tax=Methanothermobacter TaxID=145260 RepID=UPI001F5BB2FC|nr:bifunctional metallophosphatase/5'-nucleotidase [Methanothermobacter sp. THM-2]